MNNTTKNICLTALGIAIVFVATFSIRIPTGLEGYLNLGDGFLMGFATITNPLSAFLIGGVGSALADLVAGYPVYILPTLIIKGLEALIVCLFFKTNKNLFGYVGIVLAGLWMVFGYFTTEAIMYSSIESGLLGVFGNCIQALGGIVIACVLTPILARLHKK